MKTEKAYVNPDEHTAVLKCPQCGAAKVQQVGKFKGGKRRVKVTCPCQAVFHVSFEFRKTSRKETRREGYYTKLAEGGEWRRLLATDISITDIGFTTANKHNLRIGDEVKIRFTLDDDRRSRIERKAVVKRVEGRHIGCEFMAALPYDVAAQV